MASTVLIIDDNQDDILITKMVFSRIAPDIAMESALSGEAGLTLLRSDKVLPALILLDLKMPGMGGIDALRQIRSDERLKNIPVIVVTSSTLESDEKEALAAGADSFINKAFDLEQFSNDMTRILKRYLNNCPGKRSARPMR